jgi:hypothetical protein
VDPGRPSDEERQESLYRTIDRLRTAAGIRDPDVEIVARGRPGTPPARLAGTASRYRIVVTDALLDATDEARAWHLARVLSWWTTPSARWRHRLLVALCVVGGVIGAAAIAAVLADRLSVLALVVGGLLLTLAGAFCGHRLLLGRRRALEEGGTDLLRSAGYDPATARQAARSTAVGGSGR